MFAIMGKYQGREEGEIDTAETQEDASYLLGEYQLAFRGQGWKL